MVQFSTFKEQTEYNESVQKLMLAIHFSDSMNESEINEASIGDYASKIGLKISKGNGLIDYLIKFTSGAGKMLMAAIKGDEPKVREISGQMSKADFVDFLLKLDTVTMHLVTGPIHMIDAITGWDILANIAHGAHVAKEKVVKSFKDALDYVKDKIDNFMAPGDKKSEMENHVDIIAKLADPALLAV
jgi:hypothetical protein